MQQETTFFNKGWVSFDLGKYRPCHGTYCFFEYDTLPPVEETLLTGDFQWMPPLPKRLQKAAEEDPNDRIDSLVHWKNKITNLQQQAQTLGLVLPESFVTWMTNPDFLNTVESLSCTACYFDLSETLIKLPFSEEDGYVVRFLNDQQDVICWYLYLHPQKTPVVLISSIFYDGLEEELNADQLNYCRRDTLVCASHFEHFVYRFWLENDIWNQLHGSYNELSPLHQAYLQHCEQFLNEEDGEEE